MTKMIVWVILLFFLVIILIALYYVKDAYLLLPRTPPEKMSKISLSKFPEQQKLEIFDVKFF